MYVSVISGRRVHVVDRELRSVGGISGGRADLRTCSQGRDISSSAAERSLEGRREPAITQEDTIPITTVCGPAESYIGAAPLPSPLVAGAEEATK